MEVDAIKTVAVLGAGTMGNGIAHVFAKAGFSVLLRDVETRFTDRALENIAKNLDREVKKGKIAEAERTTILGRIGATTEAAALRSADFVVEAVPERMELKAAVLQEVDKVLRPEVILASNTSSISITGLAAATGRPDRFLGMHFMNPVPVMALVEVIRGLQTSDATFATTMALCERLGKKPVAVNDAPGFVSNRVLMPMINEAAYCVLEGVATAEAVLDRPGHLRRYYGSALCGLCRFQVPPLPAVAQDGFGGVAGAQVGPWVLPLPQCIEERSRPRLLQVVCAEALALCGGAYARAGRGCGPKSICFFFASVLVSPC